MCLGWQGFAGVLHILYPDEISKNGKSTGNLEFLVFGSQILSDNKVGDL